MDTLLIVALHAVGYVGHVEDLIKRAVQTHDVVIAWITPAATAQSDGVGVQSYAFFSHFQIFSQLFFVYFHFFLGVKKVSKCQSVKVSFWCLPID